mgnify:CR=1 FL=1
MALNNAFTLTANEIYETLANMIISQEVFADNLGEHQTLVDKARVDGGLYGDTKLYYATDVLKSHDWLNDAEAANLLAIERPQDPEVQAIKLDVFKQIRLTLDNYLTKRAWMNEGAFSSFNGIMLGWMRETKRVYDGTLYNVFIGTTKASGSGQNVKIDASGARGNASTELEADKLEAMAIARGLADLFVEMSDYSRKFNDYGYLRSYAKDGLKVIWNAKYVNQIKKVDLPTIFHKEGLVDKFEEEVLAPRYFGRAVAASDKGEGKVIGADGAYDPTKGTIRSKVEKDIGVGSGTASAGTAAQHVFPGDEIPSGSIVAASAGDSVDFLESEVYVEDDKVIAKVVVKLPPFMSAFEVGTTFFNPRSLTENHYLTFGHNSLAYLKNYPFITVKAA